MALLVQELLMIQHKTGLHCMQQIRHIFIFFVFFPLFCFPSNVPVCYMAQSMIKGQLNQFSKIKVS
jgi:hypothetical protein